MGEGVDVEIERASAPEDASVAHPAETLIALRAVSGYRDEVAALSPGSELIHLVQRFAGAGKANRWGCGQGVIDNAFYRRECGRCGECGSEYGEFDIAKPVKGESRLPGFVTRSRERIGIGSVGVAKVFGIDGAIGIEAFRKAELHHRAARTTNVDADNAHHVLLHVVNRARSDGVHRFGRQSDGGMNREIGLSGEEHRSCRWRACDSRGPVARVEGGGAPSVLNEAGIEGFAAIDFR